MMNRGRSGGLVAVAALLLGTITPVRAATTQDVAPPSDIQFRQPFVSRDDAVVDANVAPPDSIVFRQPFVGRGDTPLVDAVSAPRGLEFRDPFVGREDSGLRENVSAPEGIVFRQPFVGRDGAILDENVAPPSGIVFRELFFSRTSDPTAAPDAPPARLIEQARFLPNPFNPATQIHFRLNHPETVSVAVYDQSGRRVRTLFQGDLPADLHVMRWDGTDDDGQAVASGVYLVRIAADQESVVVKGVLVK